MFPFLFIKPINYDYQGPYPDKMFYNYKDKTEEQKKAFDEFHNEMVTVCNYCLLLINII